MLITSQDVRNNFRIETPLPDAIIDRHITYVDDCYASIFGDIYTSLDTSQPSEMLDVFTKSQLYLVMSRLVSERYVVTGFGVVEKKDDYSSEIYEEKYYTIARSLVKDASTILHRLHLDKTTDVIQACTSVSEGFFEKKERNPKEYYPYTYFGL